MTNKKQQEALKWILTFLEKHRIPYQITGGLAAKIYGSKRKLIDIDIAIPKKYFQKLFFLTKEYVEYGPSEVKGKLWQAYYMKINYKGQIIEIDNFNTKIFDKKEKKWKRIGYSSKKSEIKKFLGLKIKVIPKKTLLKYKKILHRKVDLEDMKDISSEPDN
jgi:hypothetical protein